MGGKALTQIGIKTIRTDTKNLNRIYNEVSKKLNLLNIETHLVKFYSSKETHGDIDILLKMDKQFNFSFKDWVLKNFVNTKGAISNGSIISFEFDNVQVDLIPVKQSNWEVSKTFFDYDPTGNLMGKISHQFGIKYGFKGLVYPFRNFNGRLSKDITISKDNKKIFDFLGYDFDIYNKGFNNLEEIFNFIINGKFFNANLFLLANLTNADRKRNKKRKTYNEFLLFLRNTCIHSEFEFQKKETYIDLIDNVFPDANLKIQLKELKRTDLENKMIHDKFNGNLIMKEFSNLKGKDLGINIHEFKNSFSNFHNFALTHSQKEIMKQFKTFIIN